MTTLGADKAYHQKKFVTGCRQRNLSPHPACKEGFEIPGLDGRTTGGTGRATGSFPGCAASFGRANQATHQAGGTTSALATPARGGGADVRGVTPGDWRLEPIFQPPTSGQLHRLVRRCLQQRPKDADAAHQQVWQPARPGSIGRSGVAPVAASTPMPPDPKMAACAAQSPIHLRRAQTCHRRHRAATGR